MGLFDDIMGIAREVNDIKTEITGTLGDAVQSLSDVQGEATDTIQQLQQDVVDSKDTITSDINSLTENK